MKIIVTGSLGHISLPLTKQLVQKGHSVIVISSKPEKRKDIESLGAMAAIGTLEDAEFLTSTFQGADAVYSMIPPPDFFNPNLDLTAEYHKIANSYAQAFQGSGIKRVVHLSSIGAHLEKDSGLIVAHYIAEGVLNKLSNVDITFMRPTSFYYNLFSFVDGIKNMGLIASNYGGDDKVSWVSPRDIADAIVKELETSGMRRKVLYVASDERTCNEVASILGTAIGKPDLKWVTITDEQLQTGLESFGVSKQIAAGLVGLNASIHTGVLFEDYYHHKPVMGKVKMTDFARDFAGAFNQK